MSRSLTSNKKGDISSIMLLIVIIFFLAFSGLTIHYVTSRLTGSIKNATASITDRPEVNQTLDTATTRITSMFDYMIFGLIAGLIIVMMITAYAVPSNPVLLPLFMIIWVIAIIVSASVSNVWMTSTTNSTLNASVSSFPITNRILSYLPISISIIGVIIMILMYAKRRNMEGDFGQI